MLHNICVSFMHDVVYVFHTYVIHLLILFDLDLAILACVFDDSN